MTIPGNVLPKIFSVPWDEAPPRDSDHAECLHNTVIRRVVYKQRKAKQRSSWTPAHLTSMPV